MSADLAGLREDLRQLVREEGLEVSDYAQQLGYDYWPADHVLRVGWLQHLTCVVCLNSRCSQTIVNGMIAHGAAYQHR